MPDDSANWAKLAGIGFEFLAAILLLGGIGWWLDQTLNTRPWLLITGCALGFLLGLWLMIKAAARSFHD
jgi:F0F1-type ATP synthase assembly protein I